MKNIIAATALALMAGFAAAPTTAYADAHAMKMGAVATEQKGDFFAADFIGKEIYTTETDYDMNTFVTDGFEKDWENIGQVENIVLNQDGSVRAVILEIGGFLDIGDKHVAVPMKDITFIRNEGSWDDYFLAVRTTKDDLTARPEYVYMTVDQRREMYKMN